MFTFMRNWEFKKNYFFFKVVILVMGQLPITPLIGPSWNPTIFNIIRWVGGSLGRWSHRPSVWCSKYYNFLQNSLQKLFQFNFHFSYKFTKIKIKSFECPKSMRNYKKKNAWNIRRLVEESFIPVNQWTSILYCRLSDFYRPTVYKTGV